MRITSIGILISILFFSLHCVNTLSEHVEETVKSLDELLQQGESLYGKGAYEDAVKAYDRAIEIDPKNVVAWKNKGLALLELGKAYDVLRSCKGHDVEGGEISIEYPDTISVLYSEDGIKSFDKYIDTMLDDIDSMEISRITSFYEDAADAFQKTLETDRKDAKTWNNYGSVLNRLERYYEALKAFEKANKLESEDAETWADLGNTLYKIEEYEEAIDAIDKSIGLDPKRAETLFLKGKSLCRLREYKEALIMFTRAAELYSKDDTQPDLKKSCAFTIGVLQKRDEIQRLADSIKERERTLAEMPKIELDKAEIHIPPPMLDLPPPYLGGMSGGK